MEYWVVLFSIAIGLLIFGHLDIQEAEAKGFYSSDLGQTYAVFTMIALALAGFGILIALYSKESIELEQH